MTAALKTIAAQIETLKADYSDEYTWGVRWDDAGLPVGHVFSESRVWADDQPTGEYLNGTSVIAASGLRHIKAGNHYMGVPYIVCGIETGYGEDAGEVILTECEIMAAA